MYAHDHCQHTSQVSAGAKRWPFLLFFMKINRLAAVVNDMPHLFMALDWTDSGENIYRGRGMWLLTHASPALHLHSLVQSVALPNSLHHK